MEYSWLWLSTIRKVFLSAKDLFCTSVEVLANISTVLSRVDSIQFYTTESSSGSFVLVAISTQTSLERSVCSLNIWDLL